jgi:twitching motility protein PilT
MDIHTFLEITVEKGASDLHLKVHSAPVLRIDGVLTPIMGEVPLTPEKILQALEDITTPNQRAKFQDEWELDFSYSYAGLARFRVNASLQRGSISLSMRCVPVEVPTIEQFRLPDVCRTLALKPRGLVLVTGPTGCGKSTTLAAMIDYLNERETKTSVCIEDPIEFLHNDKRCFITQRELGGDTRSFATALIHSFRQDPDVIMVGEMRDLETVATAITAAETGHLVLSTLHTMGAVATIDRIIDIFPPYQQPQIRSQLAVTLQAVLSQNLLSRANGSGRIAAFEIMLNSYAICNLIRESRTHEIPTLLETNSKQGMQTLDQGLEDLVKAELITRDEALARAHRPKELRARLLNGALEYEEDHNLLLSRRP